MVALRVRVRADVTTSPPDNDNPQIAPPTAPSSGEVERLRQHSIRVLASAADALEAAAQQRHTLLAAVQIAEQTLRELADERELAEASLATTRARLDDAATQLTQAWVQRIDIMSEVDDALSAGLHSRVALNAEVAALERYRDALASAAAEAQVVVVSDTAPVVVGPAEPPVVDLKGLVRVRAIHPGFGNVVTALFIALLLAMALLLSPLTQVFGGLQLLAVTSGSMAPSIPTGSMVGVRPVPASDLKIGDVITFVNLNTPDLLVTHRIVGLDLRDGQTMLTTKGDANDAVDALSAPASRAVGRVEFALPLLGDVMMWLGSPMAKIVSVCLAVLAMALSVASVRRSTRRSLVAH